MFRCALTAFICSMVFFTGCQTFTSSKPSSKSSKKSSWFKFGKKDYQTPQSLAVIWKEDVIYVPGKAPTRGFGGRIYFYNEKWQAVPVDGELVVYGYDENKRRSNPMSDLQPDKKFKFTAEQFTQHFSETQLGASYNVWIPWDDAAGEPKKITLIPTFVTKDGGVVRGDPNTQYLPGQSTGESSEMFDSSVRTVSYEESSKSEPKLTVSESTTPMRTTTIGVPSEVAMKLAHANRGVSQNNDASPASLQAPPSGPTPSATPSADAQYQEALRLLQQYSSPLSNPLVPDTSGQQSPKANGR